MRGRVRVRIHATIRARVIPGGGGPLVVLVSSVFGLLDSDFGLPSFSPVFVLSLSSSLWSFDPFSFSSVFILLAFVFSFESSVLSLQF